MGIHSMYAECGQRTRQLIFWDAPGNLLRMDLSPYTGCEGYMHYWALSQSVNTTAWMLLFLDISEISAELD